MNMINSICHEMAHLVHLLVNATQALFTLRQVYLATLDMTIHGEQPPQTEQELQSLVDTGVQQDFDSSVFFGLNDYPDRD